MLEKRNEELPANTINFDIFNATQAIFKEHDKKVKKLALKILEIWRNHLEIGQAEYLKSDKLVNYLHKEYIIKDSQI